MSRRPHWKLPRKPVEWTPEMDAKVREYWRTGLASSFWELPGVTASQVVERACELGLGDRNVVK